MARAMYVDSFTSLDDVKGRDRSDDLLVLRTIMKNGGRFSVFDADNDAMAHTLTRIMRSGWVKPRNDVGYPWTILDLTEAGHQALATTPVPSENTNPPLQTKDEVR